MAQLPKISTVQEQLDRGSDIIRSYLNELIVYDYSKDLELEKLIMNETVLDFGTSVELNIMADLAAVKTNMQDMGASKRFAGSGNNIIILQLYDIYVAYPVMGNKLLNFKTKEAIIRVIAYALRERKNQIILDMLHDAYTAGDIPVVKVDIEKAGTPTSLNSFKIATGVHSLRATNVPEYVMLFASSDMVTGFIAAEPNETKSHDFTNSYVALKDGRIPHNFAGSVIQEIKSYSKFVMIDANGTTQEMKFGLQPKNGNPDVEVGFMFYKDAIAMATNKNFNSLYEWECNDQMQQYFRKFLYTGAKIINPEAVVAIECKKFNKLAIKRPVKALSSAPPLPNIV